MVQFSPRNWKALLERGNHGRSGKRSIGVLALAGVEGGEYGEAVRQIKKKPIPGEHVIIAG
jgi:hypothetical protein